jgi:dolichyl-phosphate beta-glucosyltransferase
MLFVDADGASKFSDLQLLQDEMDRISISSGHAVSLGSRAHLVKTEAVVKVPLCSFPQ